MNKTVPVQKVGKTYLNEPNGECGVVHIVCRLFVYVQCSSERVTHIEKI